MRRLRAATARVACISVAALGPACSSDTSAPSPGDDVGVDVSSDSAVDDDAADVDLTDTDDAVDVADADPVDADAPDADAAPPEVCDDGVDNDTDGDIDCDDADCDDDWSCPQRELCGDGIDNDLDGDIDCSDEDCCGSLSCRGCNEPDPCDDTCTSDQLCIGGGCADPFDVESYVPADRFAYVARVQIGRGPTSPAACCFDVEGNGDLDNGFSTNLHAVLNGILGDIDEALNAAITSGTLTLLVEYEEFPEGNGPARFRVWDATNDLDGDGTPDDADRAAGGATFRLRTDTLTAHGPALQLNAASLTDGRAYTLLSRDSAPLPHAGILPGATDAVLDVWQLEVEAILDAEDPRFSTKIDIGPETFGGVRVGGFVSLADVLDDLDTAARGCTCAVGIDGTAPVIAHGEGATSYSALCAQTAYDVSACTDDFCASDLNLVCGELIPRFSTMRVADVDANGSGIDDSVSFGLFVTLVSAEIDRDAPFVTDP